MEITNLIVREDGHLDFLLSMTFLLGMKVHFLLTLLLTTTLKGEHEGNSGFVGDAVVSESAFIIKLSRFLRDETLLFNGNT